MVIKSVKLTETVYLQKLLIVFCVICVFWINKPTNQSKFSDKCQTAALSFHVQ